MRLQGGEISVTSDAHGSTFLFYFQCARAEVPPTSAAVNNAEQGTASQSSLNSIKQKVTSSTSPIQTGSPTKHRKLAALVKDKLTRSYDVLLVEDNLVNQRVMRRQLERLGCKVHVANHGLEALNTLKDSVIYRDGTRSADTFNIDVVLMDIEMPIMDGLMATRNIRVMQDQGLFLRHVPIIAITANARPKQVEDTLSAGIDLVLHKPFTLKELTEKLDSILGGETAQQ